MTPAGAAAPPRLPAPRNGPSAWAAPPTYRHRLPGLHPAPAHTGTADVGCAPPPHIRAPSARAVPLPSHTGTVGLGCAHPFRPAERLPTAGTAWHGRHGTAAHCAAAAGKPRPTVTGGRVGKPAAQRRERKAPPTHHPQRRERKAHPHKGPPPHKAPLNRRPRQMTPRHNAITIVELTLLTILPPLTARA
ncbi:hypothetical protein GCM10010252_17440 [Streptomyces aureoverticillatus]|nr:hypothetical protein GCM10010252_17440 [Streptomyces aureoverticillatus]